MVFFICYVVKKNKKWVCNVLNISKWMELNKQKPIVSSTELFYFVKIVDYMHSFSVWYIIIGSE